ncbi:MAG: sigma-54-dependent transcriptional regulator [Desulfatiglandales bacterium]
MILVVDDEEAVLRSLEGVLADEGFEVISSRSGEEALRLLAESNPDIMLLDIWMPKMDGIEVLKRVKEEPSGPEVIVMTGHGNIETAVKCIKMGAYDFIEKPLDYEKLFLSINRALEHKSLKQEVNLLREKDRNRYTITGKSLSIQELLRQIDKVAPTDAWVLIEGENGTGKELVARSIHLMSKRKDGPWVDVNCAAIPEELIESELFGHEKGAFTGATSPKKGKFDMAHRGTLFLDEIGDLSLKAQAKVLRILQEQTFTRVGGIKVIKVDVRVVAATNKDLKEEIKRGRFREDLYYRLNVVPIRVPPLRERLEDIPELIDVFQNSFSQNTGIQPKVYTKKALLLLQSYNWPGNVRELKNLVERLMIMVPKSTIGEEDLPPPYGKGIPREGVSPELFEIQDLREAKAQFERLYITKRLKEVNWNISLAAELMGIERSHLHKKIKDLEITKDS